MMDSDVQFDIIVDRARSLRERRRYINMIKASCISLCVSVVCFLSVILFIPENDFESDVVIGQNAGSILIKENLKTVMICALSFAAGVFFTLVCINIRRLKQRSGKDDYR